MSGKAGQAPFLSVDPVAGGNSNDYNYPNDPINANDLSGNRIFDGDDRDSGAIAGQALWLHKATAKAARAFFRKSFAWSTEDELALLGIALGGVALASSVVVALPVAVTGLAASEVTAVAVTGVIAGGSGAFIDGTECFKNHNSTGCAGMIFDTAATGFGAGGLAIPAEMAAGYDLVTLPYALTGAGLDFTIGGKELTSH